MKLQLHSQSLLPTQSVKTLVTPQGDTLIQMKVQDAKVILTILKECELTDSLVTLYKIETIDKTNMLNIQSETIKILQSKDTNNLKIVKNLNKVVENKDTEIKGYKSDIIKKDKQIKVQKTLKTIGFIGCIILPFLTLLYASGGNL
jgi:hypothetical protein